MYEFGNEFAGKFADMLDGMFSSKVPGHKKCETKKELAEWFSQFGRACATVKPKPSQVK